MNRALSFHRIGAHVAKYILVLIIIGTLLETTAYAAVCCGNPSIDSDEDGIADASTYYPLSGSRLQSIREDGIDLDGDGWCADVDLNDIDKYYGVAEPSKFASGMSILHEPSEFPADFGSTFYLNVTYPRELFQVADIGVFVEGKEIKLNLEKFLTSDDGSNALYKFSLPLDDGLIQKAAQGALEFSIKQTRDVSSILPSKSLLNRQIALTKCFDAGYYLDAEGQLQMVRDADEYAEVDKCYQKSFPEFSDPVAVASHECPLNDGSPLWSSLIGEETLLSKTETREMKYFEKVNTCVHMQGNGPNKVSFMRDTTLVTPTSPASVTRSWLLGQARKDSAAILGLDPFKTYADEFSIYVELAPVLFYYDDSGGPYQKNSVKGTSCKGTRIIYTNDRAINERGALAFIDDNMIALPPDFMSWAESVAKIDTANTFILDLAKTTGHSGVLLHEFSHIQCGLFDEYLYGKSADLPIGSGYGKNCAKDPVSFMGYAENSGNGYSSCTSAEAFKSSSKSIMRTSTEYMNYVPRYNVVSCGYCMAKLKGGKASDHFAECNTDIVTVNGLKK